MPLIAIVLGFPRVVCAEDARIDGLVAALNQAAEVSATRQATVARIAGAVALTSDALRVEQAYVALPWGDVYMAHRLAERSGYPVEKVFRARKTGASWHEIATDAKVDDALLEGDILGAFPTLTPIAVPPPPAPAPPPAATGPPAPVADTTPAAKPVTRPQNAPEKKPQLGDRFRDPIKSGDDSPRDRWQDRQREEETRDFIQGKPRLR